MMLMNISTSVDNPISQSGSAKVSGGRWKDRRKAKMMLQGKNSHVKRKASTLIDSNKNTDFNESADNSTNEMPRKQAKIQNRPLPPVNQQVISSLFTASREISTAVNNNEHDDNIEINPSNAPLLQDSFEALGVSETILPHLSEKMKITKPTRVQKLSIPNLVAGDNDIFIHAQTGSGKTLAFLLPILTRILDMKTRVDRQSGCFAMIITPTRELASQIYSVMALLTQCCHYLVPCLLIGGERKKSEKARLRKGCNFIIGTPGRILDHLQNTKVIREQLCSTLRYLVLDEGDKLMELGFEQTITEIIKLLYDLPLDTSKFSNLPDRIIHVLCSATRKGGVNKLGNLALHDYKLISSGQKQEEMSTVPDQLLQKIAIVPPKLRLVTLAGVLNNITQKQLSAEKMATVRTIVFLSCSDSVDFHYEAFSSTDANYRTLVGDSVRLLTKDNHILPCLQKADRSELVFYKLHGSLSQQIRTATLQNFSTESEATKGKHLVMFCTDVASRGLDLPHVSTVIEVDPPFAVEDHLHRIGRTARAGVSGESLLFLLPGEEEGYMDYIKPYHPQGWKLLKYEQDILKPAFQDSSVKKSDSKSSSKPDKLSTEWDNNATTWHLNIERRVLEDQAFKDCAMKGYTSHIRAYATHLSQEKKFFNLKCLHLGHLAKSFALRERPKAMGNANAKKRVGEETQKRPKEDAKSKMLRMARQTLKESVSEFNY